MGRQFLYSIWEVLEVVLIASVTVLVIRYFIVQPFLVSGASMFDTFIDGDYVLVDELSYRFKNLERGDVVVFRYPLNPKLYYIKRVIGISGDRIVVNSGGVFVNDVKITEEYLDEGIYTGGNVDVVIKDGQFFAMGDNRPHSYDSRSFGVVPLGNTIGVVRVRLLPFTSAQIFERPDYGL